MPNQIGRKVILAIAAAMAVLKSGVAYAEDTPCLEFSCRAHHPYGNCAFADVDHHTEKGSIAFVGTVTNSIRSACEWRITVEIAQSSRSSLPSTIQIGLGPCKYLHGQMGAVIKAFVSDTPRDGIYEARICYR
jgi:hypothetical protein